MTYATPSQPSINPRAFAWTVGIHLLILLLCLLVKYSSPPEAPPMEELGMEVNLGTSEDGWGIDQPEEPGDPADASPTVASLAGGATTDHSDMLRADEADAPEIPPTTATARRPRTERPNNTRPTTTTNTQRPTSNTPTPATRNPRYVYSGGTGPGGNGGQTTTAGGAEGNTSGPGDRGVPGGTPGASNYEGSPGRGTGGIGHTLSGRRVIAPPMEAAFREGGKVVVRVTVNRAGTIVSQRIQSASSAELRRVALEKMSQVRFNAAPDAPEEQFGTITFVFKTRS